MYLFYNHPINPAQPPALRFVRTGPGKRFSDILHTGKYKGDDFRRRNKTPVLSETMEGLSLNRLMFPQGLHCTETRMLIYYCQLSIKFTL